MKELKKLLTVGAARAFVFLTVAALFFLADAQTTTAQDKARLCAEKKNGLAEFEAEASRIHERVNILERRLDVMENLTPEQVDRALAVAVLHVERDKLGDPENLKSAREWMDFLTTLKNKEFFGDDEISESPYYRKGKTTLEEFRKREGYVANQIFLLRDSVKSLGCDGTAVETGGTFDPAKYPFFKETKTWDLSLINESVSLGSRTEKKIFRLKTVGNEYNSSISAILSNAVPLSYIFGDSWMGNADFNCNADFDGDTLSFGCGQGSERDLFIGRFEVTVVECVKPRLKGMLSYKGGYKKPARDWQMSGQLDWDPLPPPDCTEKK